ncbi:acyltransferase [Pedobacter sp. AJM]|uniref:acyltransferase family protein n=1 Tax=Pedobacter sp. AJM TaxID=2003629 RepID=UPI000B4BE525|nr:acyltransferase [Pedobacter sp. AJM]OWK71349.1 acyltransferase [Pedobacter sp. AJM]
MKSLTLPILQSRQHFPVLDGLRGVAALAIVIFHFMEIVFTDFTQNIIGHGFLAVDFFFCLSGFVIGYAYDNRLEEMGILEFFKSRIIRLHPLVLFGSVLGLFAFLFDPFGGQPFIFSTGKIILLFISSALLIPFPAMEERAFNLFGLNAPSWSLFWEYVANIFYAFILARLHRKYLVILAIIAAILLGVVAYRAGSLMGGWAGDNFWDGGARIFYSFIAGLLVYRFKWTIKNNLGFFGLSILLSLAFLMPFFSYSWLAELAVVLFYFPLIIALGVGTKVHERLIGLCHFSGKISYPLYMTHYSAIWMFNHYYSTYKPQGKELSLLIIAGVMVLLCLAYLTMVWYDLPVRKYLSRKRIKSDLPK